MSANTTTVTASKAKKKSSKKVPKVEVKINELVFTNEPNAYISDKQLNSLYSKGHFMVKGEDMDISEVTASTLQKILGHTPPHIACIQMLSKMGIPTSNTSYMKLTNNCWAYTKVHKMAAHIAADVYKGLYPDADDLIVSSEAPIIGMGAEAGGLNMDIKGDMFSDWIRVPSWVTFQYSQREIMKNVRCFVALTGVKNLYVVDGSHHLKMTEEEITDESKKEKSEPATEKHVFFEEKLAFGTPRVTKYDLKPGEILAIDARSCLITSYAHGYDGWYAIQPINMVPSNTLSAAAKKTMWKNFQQGGRTGSFDIRGGSHLDRKSKEDKVQFVMDMPKDDHELYGYVKPEEKEVVEKSPAKPKTKNVKEPAVLTGAMKIHYDQYIAPLLEQQKKMREEEKALAEEAKKRTREAKEAEKKAIRESKAAAKQAEKEAKAISKQAKSDDGEISTVAGSVSAKTTPTPEKSGQKKRTGRGNKFVNFDYMLDITRGKNEAEKDEEIAPPTIEIDSMEAGDY